MALRLKDGSHIVLRPITPEDKSLLTAALGRLSVESACKRFLAPKPRFTGKELRYLTELDFTDHYALAALPADRPDLIVGVGRWVRSPEQRDSAEIAIVVADHLQGKGLGRTLGRALADAARERGVRRFTATLLSENAAAQRLFAAISERLDVHHLGTTHDLVAELAA